MNEELWDGLGSCPVCMEEECEEDLAHDVHWSASVVVCLEEGGDHGRWIESRLERQSSI